MFDTEEAGQQAAAHGMEDAPLARDGDGTPGAEGSAGALKGFALFAMPALIAGCGGGGGGGGAGGGIFPGVGGGGNPQPDTSAPADTGPYHYLQARSDAEAARFLLQAQFSASEAEIATVRSLGYLPWLEQQFNAPRTQTAWEWVESQPYNGTDIDATVWRQLMLSGDAVRKRMALALSEIFVVSANDIGSSWPTHMMAQYWDMLAAGATGNFRQLLEAVTLNPAMGFYLNTRGNQKENNRGRQPDENYAREVMQLMRIGLQQLEADGTPKTRRRRPAARQLHAERREPARARVHRLRPRHQARRAERLPPAGCELHRRDQGLDHPADGARREPPLDARGEVPRRHRARQHARRRRAQDRARHAVQPPERRPLHRAATDPAAGHEQPEPGLREAAWPRPSPTTARACAAT